MTRSARAAAALLLVGLVLVGCGDSEDPAADAPTESSPTAEQSPTAEETAAPQTPSTSASTSATTSPSADAAGPVAAFDSTALCPTDRALSEKVTGAPLTTDEVFKAGDPVNGAPAQGDTCLLEGPQGSVETSVITEPSLVERRKALDFATIAPCETAPLDGGWDKAWTCDLPAGYGPVLLRNGADSVFTCFASSKGGRGAAAVTNGRAVCDAVLAAVSG